MNAYHGGAEAPAYSVARGAGGGSVHQFLSGAGDGEHVGESDSPCDADRLLRDDLCPDLQDLPHGIPYEIRDHGVSGFVCVSVTWGVISLNTDKMIPRFDCILL